MSVLTEGSAGFATGSARIKPKPYSIERRFRLMQSATLALAVFLSSTALYLESAHQSHLAALISGLHVTDAEAQRLEQLDAEMRNSSGRMLVALIAFAAFSIAVSIWFGRAHKRHIWRHLDELSQLVSAVRRGNLTVSAEIPDSIEFGPLMRAFLEMAAELAAMRTSLEKKVLDRTAKLELAQKELLQSAKLASLGQLVSGVAHEINNPLTSILGFSEIVLGRPGIDPAALAPLRTIREEALRLKNVVANLSSFARRAPHRTQRLDLRTVINRLIELREYHLRADNISIHVAKQDGPVWVIADPDQLMQVLLNLLLNSEQAIRDIRDSGDVWIECRADGRLARISLRDNGAGISREIRERVFEPFFTTRQPGQGAGLGLAISHGIIEQHQGTISAESTAGEGTTIRIELPLSPEKRSDTAPTNSLPAASPAAKHALVIDDEDGILEMVGDTLERFGCRVTLLHGSSGVEAALKNTQFDAVICDLKMPGQNGLEVYRFLRRTYPELASHFLLMTGNLADAQEHGAEIASVPLLPKPFTLVRLREAVSQLLTK